MTKKLLGLFASVALLGSGMALAGDDKQKGQQTGVEQKWGEDAYGGSGQMKDKQAGMMKEKKDLTGTVVKSSAKELHVRTADGFIVPVKINNQTQFQDPTVKRAKDLKEGQMVRASLDIQGTENVAQSISLATDTGMGGAGMEHEGMDHDKMKDKDKPMQPDTGGAGLDDNQGFDPDLDPGVGDDIGTEPIERQEY